MSEITLLFPHQLFETNPVLKLNRQIYLIEEFLFFNQFHFHKQKIAFHRASMKFYESFLKNKKYQVKYIDSQNSLADIRQFIPELRQKNIKTIHFIDPMDDWLKKRLIKNAKAYSVKLIEHPTPMFLSSNDEIRSYFENVDNLLQTKFYISQRKKRKILIDSNNRPVGGKWTFDSENRKKYPKDKIPPLIQIPEVNLYLQEAKSYTTKYYPNNPGNLDVSFVYPTTFEESKNWYQQFLEQRFAEFGAYEDAMVSNSHILNHSLLSPLLNTGLLTSQYVLDTALKYYDENNIPINSCEGFVRQILGWREFIRGIYEYHGGRQRTENFWDFSRKLPSSFYSGTTGIEPLDKVIKKVLNTGYCHHIERLMILGNFMLLCEIDPNEVYRWFMEMFIDAYDWVMVPNVYGMSQFADGGLMATKPYISGSNYILKMSDFKKGDWQKIWDGLFWRFMHEHREFFLQNPRLGMLVRSFDKMPEEKQKMHINNAENFLRTI